MTTHADKRAEILASIRARAAGGKVNPPEVTAATIPAPPFEAAAPPEPVAEPQPPVAPPVPDEPAQKPKRNRRTKAQMEAARAAAAAGPVATVDPETTLVYDDTPIAVRKAREESTAANPAEAVVTLAADTPTSPIKLELPPTGSKPVLITLTIKIDQVSE